MQHFGVLSADGGDEVVDSEHLDHGEEGDEHEPGRGDLLSSCLSVQGTVDSGSGGFLLFGLDLGFCIFRA